MTDDIDLMCKEARRFQTEVGVATVAALSDTEVPVFVAPCSGWITKIGIVPKAAVTGHDDNNYTLSCQDKGAAGIGTDEICSKEYAAGVDSVAFDHEDLGTLTNAKLAAGDTVTLLKTEKGTGLVMPDLIVVIEFLPDEGEWN